MTIWSPGVPTPRPPHRRRQAAPRLRGVPDSRRGLLARRGGLHPLGHLPALLDAARAGRRRRDPRAPHRVVAAHDGAGPRPVAPGAPAQGAPARPAPAAAHLLRRRRHHVQLGRLHLGRQQRPRRRDLAGLLHQPARHRADGRAHPRRAAAPPPVGGDGHRLRRGGRAGASTTAGRRGSRSCSPSRSAPTACSRSRPASARWRASRCETVVLAPFALAYIVWLVVDRRRPTSAPTASATRSSSPPPASSPPSR